MYVQHKRRRSCLDYKPILKRILTTPGISGREEQVATVVKEEFEKYCDEVWIHPTQSVIGLKRGNIPIEGGRRHKLMYAAHLDQIGLIVSKIESGGFLRLSGIGYDFKTLPGQRVQVFGKETVSGIIGTLSSSTIALKEGEKPIDMKDIYVDTGLPEQQVDNLISVGDPVLIDAEPVELKGNLYAGPALDDRACVMGLILGMEKLQRLTHAWDIYFVATCGEESSGKGARTCAYEIDPDAGCAFDVCFANQSGASEPHTVPLGKGLYVSMGPIYDRNLYKKITKICGEENIPFNPDPDVMGFGTDAASIRMTRGGIPTNLVSLAIKNMHLPVEVMHLDDLKNLGRFVAAYAANIHREWEEPEEDQEDSKAEKEKGGAE
jgi:tetrahedral aminopeptidase